MGRGAVHPGLPESRDAQTVQRVRVAGAEDTHGVEPPRLRRLADAPHEAGFARPRAALDDMQKLPFAGEPVVERSKTLPGVCREKECLIQSCSPFLLYCMQKGGELS